MPKSQNMNQSQNKQQFFDFDTLNKKIQQLEQQNNELLQIDEEYAEYQVSTDIVIKEQEIKCQRLQQELFQEQKQNQEINLILQQLQNENSELMRLMSLKNQDFIKLQQEFNDFKKLLQDKQIRNRSEEQTIKTDNSDIRSSFAWLQTAYDTRGKEIDSLKAELARHNEMSKMQSVTEQLHLQTSINSSQLNQSQLKESQLGLSQVYGSLVDQSRPPKEIFADLELQQLKQCLYRSLVINTALGAPFDVFDDTLTTKLINDANLSQNINLQKPFDQFGSQISDSDVQQFIVQQLARGLFKLGMRIRDDNPEKPWKENEYEGGSGEMDNDFTNYCLLKQKNLQQKSHIEQLELKISSLNQQISQQVDLINNMGIQKEKLLATQLNEQKLSKRILDAQNQRNIYLTSLFEQINSYIGNLVSDFENCKDELVQDCQKKVIRNHQLIQENYNQVELLISAIKQQQATDIQQKGGLITQFDAQNVVQELKQTSSNLEQLIQSKPDVIDISTLFAQNYNIPVPPSILAHLDKINDQSIQQVQQARKQNSIKDDALIYLLLKPQVVQEQILKLTKKLSSKVGEVVFDDSSKTVLENAICQFFQVIVNGNVQFDKLFNDINKLEIDEKQQFTQALAEKQIIIDDLQTQIEKLNQQLENINHSLIVEVSFNENSISYSRTSSTPSLKDLITKCSKQNKSSRYLSFLESLVAELVQFYATNQIALFQATQAMQDLVKEQKSNYTNQQNTYIQFAKAFGQCVDEVTLLADKCDAMRELSDSRNQFMLQSQELLEIFNVQTQQFNDSISSLNKIYSIPTYIANFVPQEIGGLLTSQQLQQIQLSVNQDIININEQLVKQKVLAAEERVKSQNVQNIQYQHEIEKAKKFQHLCKQLEERVLQLEKEISSVRKRYICATTMNDSAKTKLLTENKELHQKLEQEKAIHFRNLRTQAEEFKRTHLDVRISLEEQIHTLLKQKCIKNK